MAGLAQSILAHISDAKPLGAHLGKDAFRALFNEYKEISELNDSLPLITDESTGFEFKAALNEMSAAEQVAIFYPYLRATVPKYKEEESQVELHSRVRMREWFIRMIAYTIIGALVLLVGAAVAIAWRSGHVPSSEVIDTFLKTATDIAEILFSHSHE